MRLRLPARRPKAWFCLALFAGLTAGPAARQQPQTGPGSQPTFRSGVDLVTLDVIPRDANGQFAGDLTLDDFEVYEDGVRQSLVSLVRVTGGRVFNLQAAPAPPREVDGIILPAQRPSADAGRIFIIVIDDLHFSAEDTPYVRDLLKKVSATLIHQGDLFAIVSTGPSAIAVHPTYDRGVIQEAISRVRGNALSPQDLFARPEGSQGPVEVRERAHAAFATAYQLIQQVEKVRDRRKALLLISYGYDFDPFPLGRKGEDKVFGGRYGTPYDEEQGERLLAVPLGGQQYKFGDMDLAIQLAGLTNAANRANVSVFPIDPRGVALTMSAAVQLDRDDVRRYIQKTQASLRTLAEETGGLAVVNDNDFVGALKEIDASTSDYYVIGYASSNPDVNQRTRQIEVKVTGRDLEIWSRSSYTLRPQPQ